MYNSPAHSRHISELSLSQQQSYHVSPDPTIHDRGKWCGFALQATHYGAPRKWPTQWWQSLKRSAGRIDGIGLLCGARKNVYGIRRRGTTPRREAYDERRVGSRSQGMALVRSYYQLSIDGRATARSSLYVTCRRPKEEMSDYLRGGLLLLIQESFATTLCSAQHKVRGSCSESVLWA
jgi:hypothetical protein